jgi:hypothetical protein
MERDALGRPTERKIWTGQIDFVEIDKFGRRTVTLSSDTDHRKYGVREWFVDGESDGIVTLQHWCSNSRRYVTAEQLARSERMI